MKMRRSLRHTLTLGLLGLGASLSALAQQAPPVPPPPPKPGGAKDPAAAAAAAIQAPAPMPSAEKPGAKLLPPPTRPPGAQQTLQPSRVPPTLTPPKITPPVAPAPVPAAPAPSLPPPTPPPADSSASKMQALDAVTKKGDAVVAPRIPLPADKLPVTTSTSSSGQFRVHGKELTTRSAMSSHLDQIAAELRAVLNDTQPYALPIVVQLNTGDEARQLPMGTPPVSVVVTEVTEGGFHLQLTVTEGPALKLSDLRRETVRVLLAERIVRGQTKFTKPENRLLLPDWVFTGVMQAMDYRAAARPSTMFAAIFKSGKIYGIEEIIEVSPTQMDSLSRAIYETSCAALVMALIDQPTGGQRFTRFLSSLATDPRPERDLLTAAFPEFAATSSSLNKWWALQLATLAKRGMAEPLGPDESMRALEEAVTIRYHAPEKEAPQNIKARPFVIPPPLNVIPADAPKPKPQSPLALDLPATDNSVASTSDKPAAPKKTAEGEQEKKDDEKAASGEKSSRWLSYLTFGLAGGKSSKESENDEDAKPSAKKAADKKDVAESPPETAKKKNSDEPENEEEGGGFFSRLMSRDQLRAAEERQKAADEIARAAEEKAAKTAEARRKAELAAAAKNGTAKKSDADEPPATTKEKKDSDTADEAPASGGTVFGRLMGSSRSSKEEAADKKKAEEAARAEKEKADKAAEARRTAELAAVAKSGGTKPADKPKADEKKTDSAKESSPSMLNPLNWFRGSKKDDAKKPDDSKAKSKPEEPKKEPKPAKEGEEEAAVLFDSIEQAPATSVLQWISPSLADAWHVVAPAPRECGILDFLKRNKDESKDDTKKDEASTNPAAAPAKKKETKSSSSPPKSTNPNAKPVARPVQPADGSKRTTNPAAKPVPGPEKPAATAPGANDDWLGKPPPGMVLVTLPPEEFMHLMKRPDRVRILEHNIASLRALQLRASVLFRPVVTGYLDIMLALQEGRTRGIEERLVILREAATTALQNTKAVRDYLDWYQANSTDRLSGKFDTFLNLPAIIQRELPPREDPISKYLDAIDKQFSK